MFKSAIYIASNRHYRHVLGLLRLSLFAGFVTVMGVFYASSASASSQEAYELALQSFHQENLDHTYIHLRNSLQEDPTHLPSRVLMAELLIATGDAAGAEDLLRMALAEDADEKQITPLLLKTYVLQGRFDNVLLTPVPEPLEQTAASDIHVLRGIAHFAKGDLQAAAQAYARAAALMPNNVDAMLGQARTALLQGQADAALEYADQALVIAPGNSGALLIKANSQQHRGDIEEALMSVNQLIIFHSDNLSARTTRALVLMDKGDTAGALQDLAYVLENSPGDPIANFLKYKADRAAGNLGEDEELLANMGTSLSRLPEEIKQNFPIYYYLAGFADFKQKNYSAAKSSLLKYGAIEGDDYDTLVLLGRVYIALGDLVPAKNVLEKAQELHAGEAQILSLLGDVHSALGQPRRSEYYYRQAIDSEPGDFSFEARLARLYLRTGRPDRAIEQLQHTQTASTEPEALVLLAGAFEARGDIPQALVYSGKVAALRPDDSSAMVMHGALLMRSGKLEQAEQAYHSALDLDGGNTGAVVGLSRVLVLQGKPQTSLKLLEDHLDRDEDNTDLLLEVGNVNVTNNDLKAAMICYEKAYTLDATNGKVLRRIVDVHLRNRNLPAAVALVEEQLQRGPDNPQMLQLAAELYVTGQRLDEAIVALNRLVSVSAGKPQPLLMLASLQVELDRLGDARANLTKIIEWNHELLPAHLQLIEIAVREKDTVEALRLIDRLEGINHDEAMASRLKGSVYQLAGELDRAVVSYRQSLQNSPSRQAILGLFQIYNVRQEHDVAVDLLTNWVKDNPDDLDAGIILAEMHRELRQLDQAAAMYARLLASYPENLVLLNNTAFVQLELGNLDEAVQLAERAHRGAPDSADIIDTRGWIETQRGNYDGALGLLRQASALDFDNAGIKYHLAYTLDKLERHDEARQVIAQISPAQMSGIIEQDVFHAGLSQQLVDGLNP